MYRIFSCSKDTYIQNKYIAGSRAITSNVGQAGTLDLYKLFDETTITGVSGVLELSRILIQFDYSEILNSGINVNHPSFTASLLLKNVYGGQTTPSNFITELFPLSNSWDEGRGFDVVSYKDLDTANFLSSSTGVAWHLSGANASGTLSDTNIDYVVSGNIGSGNEFLGRTCNFFRGDEDAKFNVTRLISASVAGYLANNGFRISFSNAQENDQITRFVKRFGSKQAYSKKLHPALVIEYDDRILDTSAKATFGVSQSFYSYNFINGNYARFRSGSSELTNLKFDILASKSISYQTSSYQSNFVATINHLTKSVLFYSKSFDSSEYSTGIYKTELILDPVSDIELKNFLSGSTSFDFEGKLFSQDKTVIYQSDFYTFDKDIGIAQNSQEKNYVVNVVNLKNLYSKDEIVRLRVFVQDRNSSIYATRDARKPKPTIISDMRWRLVSPYSSDIIIPFSESTRISTDKQGMYFDLYIKDLYENEVYELEFLLKENNRDFLVTNKGFIFKVIE